jgi:hypothetical protein
MAITTNRSFDREAFERSAFWQNRATGAAALNIEGLVQLADSNGDVIDPSTGASAATGGGSSTYSNAQGDFVATTTDATTDITITGLSFTLEAKHVANGSIKKITSAGVVTLVDTGNIAVASGVITLSDADNFAAGDIVVVSLTGPDKAYDQAIDAQRTVVLNPNYEHYTSVEQLVNETNLGITGTATGGDINTLTDSGAAFDAANVAVGYEAYSEEEDVPATVNTITDGTNIETDSITTSWSGDTYWLPECKRFVIPAEGYNLLAAHVRITTGDVNNAAYCKIYGTLDATADDTDDLYWVDLSTDIFGAAQLSVTGAASTEGLYFVDTPTVMLKYMIKIVAEVFDGGAAAAADQDFEVFIKKAS